MAASIPLRTVQYGVCALLIALLLGTPSLGLAEPALQRQELDAAMRQLDALEQIVAYSAAHSTIDAGQRYHFDYPRLVTDLARVRTGIQAYLAPSRAQPRDLSELIGNYRSDRDSSVLLATKTELMP